MLAQQARAQPSTKTQVGVQDLISRTITLLGSFHVSRFHESVDTGGGMEDGSDSARSATAM